MLFALIASRLHTLIEICCKVGRLKISAVSLSGLSVAFIVVSFRVGFRLSFLSPLDLRSTSRDENNHQQAAKHCDLHVTPPLRVIGASCGLFGDRTRKISSRHAYFDAVAELGFDEISRAALMVENFQPAIAVH